MPSIASISYPPQFIFYEDLVIVKLISDTSNNNTIDLMKAAMYGLMAYGVLRT